MSRTNGKRLGIGGYVRLLAALRDAPGTITELEQRGVGGRATLYRLLPQFVRAGLVYVVEAVPARGGAVPRFAYAGHPAPSAPAAKCRMLPFKRWAPEVLAFTMLMAELHEPSTCGEIQEATGMVYRTVATALKALHTSGLARIAGWSRPINGRGPWAPQYQLGAGADAKKPKRQTRQQYEKRRYAKLCALRVSKALTQLAASVAANRQEMEAA